MTDDPPPDFPPTPRPPRGRPRRQPGFDDEAVLSPEEVARRVDVRGGGTPRAPVERAPVRDRRTPPRRPERTGARDSLLLVGLVIVGLVAVRLFLPDGPLTASATATPGASQAAVATATPAAPDSGAPTGGLITLPPTPFVPAASPGPITEPPVTAAPLPTPTLKPGQTPGPTPRPTRTPTQTSPSSPAPTQGPGAATVKVTLIAINDDGGTATSSDWTVSVTSGGTASPSSFSGSTSETTVSVTAGQSYSVTAGGGPAGYATSRSAGCSSATGGVPAAGSSRTCQIIVNDIKPKLTVYTVVVGGPASPSDWTVVVTGTDVVPGSFAGSAAGVLVHLNAGATYSVDQANSGAQDYDEDPSGSCGGSGLAPGASVSCTFTFTYAPATPAPATARGPIVLLAFLPLLLPGRFIPRRWRSIRAR